MNRVESGLTAIIPVSGSRDDFERFNLWMLSADLSGITIIFVFDSCTPDNRFIDLVAGCRAEKVLIKQGNFGGPGPARNYGLLFVESEWTCFWDSDDLPNPTNIKKAIFELIDQRADVGVCEFETATWLRTGEIADIQYRGHTSRSLHQIIRTPGIWRFIFRSRLIDNNEFSSAKMGEDQAFLARVLSRKSEIAWVNQSIYTYLAHDESQLTKSRIAVNELIESTRIIYSNLKNDGEINKEFRIGLVIRQCMTILKRSPGRLKIEALKIFALLFLHNFKSATQFLIRFLKPGRKERNAKIHVVLNGGLGNQLFELSAGLNMSGHKKVVIESAIGLPRTSDSGRATLESLTFQQNVEFTQRKRWPILTRATNYVLRDGLSGSCSLKSKAARMATAALASIYFKSLTQLHVNKGVGWSVPSEGSKNIKLLIGYFQSHRFQNAHILGLLIESFNRLEGKKLSELRTLAQVENPLIVHVRLSDYRDEPDFGIPGVNYYLSAISKIYNPDVHKAIWLFSDEIDMVIDRIPLEFRGITRSFGTIDNSDEITLAAMTLGHDYVIANSTFSWWAARLSKNPTAKVIYPSPWFKKMAEPRDLFPPDWLACPSEFGKA